LILEHRSSVADWLRLAETGCLLTDRPHGGAQLAAMGEFRDMCRRDVNLKRQSSSTLSCGKTAAHQIRNGEETMRLSARLNIMGSALYVMETLVRALESVQSF